MEYQIKDRVCQVEITYKKNKNMYIRVKDQNVLALSVPMLTSKKQIMQLLEENEKAIERMLQKKDHHLAKEEKFYYLGESYDVIYMPGDMEILDHKIYVQNEKMLTKWYQAQMQQIFQEHLDYWYHQFQEKIPYPSLRIRKMKTRWGVCNRKNNTVTLNAELIRYSLDKLDYVIIHELSHFKHFDHSASFWQLVSKYEPNYKKIRKELRE